LNFFSSYIYESRFVYLLPQQNVRQEEPLFEDFKNMTLNRIITDDKVDSTITETSNNPVTSSSVYVALTGKIDVTQGTDRAGKLLKVGTSGDVVLSYHYHASTHNIGGTDAIATASSSSNGLLSSTDWNTFNNKQNALPTGVQYTIPAYATLLKSNRDTNGVYRTYTWKLLNRSESCDVARMWISTLSADYLSRTFVIYGDLTGSTVLSSFLFTRTLDEYGNLVSEELAA